MTARASASAANAGEPDRCQDGELEFASIAADAQLWVLALEARAAPKRALAMSTRSVAQAARQP
jgi:hypothetical protein